MSQPSVHPDILTRDLVKALAEVAMHSINFGAVDHVEALRRVIQLSPFGQEAAHSIKVLAQLARSEWDHAAQSASEGAVQMPGSNSLRELSQLTRRLANVKHANPQVAA